MLAWLDIESTGLDPMSDLLLEVALVITDDSLDEIGFTNAVIRPFANRALTENQMDPAVWEMHSNNGLLRAINSGEAVSPSKAEDNLITMAKRVLGDEQPPLCGSTINFDRGWMREWMPSLHNLFHYRSIDVSSLKETARRYAPSVFEEWVEISSIKPKAHRALDDIRQSIQEYSFYVSSMRNSMWMHPREIDKARA